MTTKESRLVLGFVNGQSDHYSGDKADKIYKTIKKACTHCTEWAFIQTENTEEYISMKNLCNVFYKRADTDE